MLKEMRPRHTRGIDYDAAEDEEAMDGCRVSAASTHPVAPTHEVGQPMMRRFVGAARAVPDPAFSMTRKCDVAKRHELHS